MVKTYSDFSKCHLTMILMWRETFIFIKGNPAEVVDLMEYTEWRWRFLNMSSEQQNMCGQDLFSSLINQNPFKTKGDIKGL